MDSFRFRPQVTGLEDRVTPASPAELFAYSQIVAADQGAIASAMSDPAKPRSVYTLTRAAEDLVVRTVRNEAASNAFLTTFQQMQAAQAANPAFAQAFAGPSQWVATNAIKAIVNRIQAVTKLTTVHTLLGRQGATLPASAQLPAPPAPPPTPAETGQSLSETIPPLDAPQWQEVSGSPGLRFWDVVQGTGDVVEANDTIRVHYVGWLTDGTVFDSSLERGQPLESPLSGLIQGWQRGIPGMRVGGIRRLDIPAELAYGANGSPPSIPPNARLVFEFQMLSTRDTAPTSGTGANGNQTLTQDQIQDLLNQQQS